MPDVECSSTVVSRLSRTDSSVFQIGAAVQYDSSKMKAKRIKCVRTTERDDVYRLSTYYVKPIVLYYCSFASVAHIFLLVTTERSGLRDAFGGRECVAVVRVGLRSSNL